MFAVKMISTLALRTVPVILAGLLAACAIQGKGTPDDDADHKAHHPDKSASVTTVPSMPVRPNDNSQIGMTGSMDMNSMCDTHRNVMGLMSLAERHAKMEQRTPPMLPEMRRQHMEMMAAKCT